MKADRNTLSTGVEFVQCCRGKCGSRDEREKRSSACNGPALGIRKWLRQEAIERVVIFPDETGIDPVPLIKDVVDLQGIVIEVVGSSPFPRIARGVQTITEPEIVGERHRGQQFLD